MKIGICEHADCKHSIIQGADFVEDSQALLAAPGTFIYIHTAFALPMI